jgi:RHS repeat-associated protein
MTDLSKHIQNSYAYTPFGGLTQSESFHQPFTFSGEYGVLEEPSGLYYMRARYYDPQIGRFISEDPIRFAGGDVNLYAYAGNNPVNYVDPWGKRVFGRGDDEYRLGSTKLTFLGIKLEPGKAPARYIEEYLPFAHDFSTYHDATSGMLVDAGVPVDIANVPTMIPTYIAAVGANMYQALTAAVVNSANDVLDRLGWRSDDRRYIGGGGGGGGSGYDGFNGGGK